ncbi:MAG: acyl-CoA dehydratase activase [Armatimonadota bacterium]|nr:acyl-CoA dehydratase activase [Armatimonadota bacterium]
MLTAGVDIGSLAAKAAVLDAESWQILATACLPSGSRPAESGARALQQALAAADTDLEGVKAIVSTGYGRDGISLVEASVTEISCGARGAHLIDPEVRTVLDIGGQDSKAVSVDEDGYPLDFALNDRCAAGTGRFLEVMAGALDTDLEGLERMALAAERPAPITRTCTVFAESEVVGLLARGVAPEAVAAGLCRAVAERNAQLVLQVRVRPRVMLIGGVGMNAAIAEALASFLDVGLVVPDDPQTVVATGAALVAAERMGAQAVAG